MTARRVVVGLGSNSDPARRLAAALDLLAAEFDVVARSRVRVGPAVGGGRGTYHNAAAVLRTDLPHGRLEAALRRIERALGRVRDGGDRVAIDLDVLAIEGEVVRDPDGNVRVPHPDLGRLPHATEPAREVAPDLVP